MNGIEDKTAVPAISWKQWSAALIDSLRWPVTMLLLALTFREPMSRLFGALTDAILR